MLVTIQTPQQRKLHEKEKLQKIIDKVLTQIFGKDATLLIYGHLERKYALKPEEIAERLEVFSEGLEEYLGSGAFVVKKKILEDLYSNCGLLRRLELEKIRDDCDLIGQVKALMKNPP
jgi:hypothetical protein